MVVGMADSGDGHFHQDLAVVWRVESDLLDFPVLSDSPQHRTPTLHRAPPGLRGFIGWIALMRVPHSTAQPDVRCEVRIPPAEHPAASIRILAPLRRRRRRPRTGRPARTTATAPSQPRR